MSEEEKEELKAALMLLQNVVKKNCLSMAVRENGYIMFFSIDEYLQKGNLKECDGVCFNIHNFVK